MSTLTLVPIKDTDTTFQIRFKKELYAKASKMAQKRGISLAGYIRMLILADLEKAEATNPPDKPSA